MSPGKKLPSAIPDFLGILLLIRQLSFLSVAALLLCACYGVGARERIPVTLVPVSVSVAPGDRVSVDPGDAIFVQGRVAQAPGLRLSPGISSTMPGSYHFPFDFSIGECTLAPLYQTDDHRYFAAPADKSSATHSLLGSVLAGGDSVGIRVSREDNSFEWFVDNSNHNNMSTVWHRPVRAEDGVAITEVTVPVVDEKNSASSLIYDGFYGGQVHFTWQDDQMAASNEQAFTFDVAPEGVTAVNVRGVVFDILACSNLGIEIQWVTIPAEIHD